VEKHTLPRTAIFGKDMHETPYIFNDLRAITPFLVDILFGNVLAHDHHVVAQNLVEGVNSLARASCL
jgi:hypothetical protein